VPQPNFYGINETEPGMTLTTSAAFHIGRGWKLGFSDGLGNVDFLRDETPSGCSLALKLSVSLGD
jgi:hypothetical protein